MVITEINYDIRACIQLSEPILRVCEHTLLQHIVQLGFKIICKAIILLQITSQQLPFYLNHLNEPMRNIDCFPCSYNRAIEVLATNLNACRYRVVSRKY